MSEGSEEKALFTVLEAAEYLGVSRMKIYRLFEQGELTAIPNPLDGRQKLISREQLDRLKKFSKLRTKKAEE